MRVLGVDPGLTRCGVGVVDGVPGRALSMLGVGVVRTPAEADIGRRLVLIEQGLEAWLDEHRPDAVAVERVFSQHNVRTVMGTAQASAVALLCAARRGLPVHLHTPSEVKAAVTGSGRAGKDQVGAMVTRLLRLDAPPKPADAADALALAICHIWRAPATGRLQQAVAAHRAAGLAAAARVSGQAAAAPASGQAAAAPAWRAASAAARARARTAAAPPAQPAAARPRPPEASPVRPADPRPPEPPAAQPRPPGSRTAQPPPAQSGPGESGASPAAHAARRGRTAPAPHPLQEPR